MYSKIMIPVDLAHTDQLEKALAVAAEMARPHDAELHMVGVTMSSPTTVAATPEEYAQKLSAYAGEKSQAYGMTFTPHTEVSHDIIVDLDDVLQDAADKLGADLIVMASHVPGLAEYVFASNAGYLASHASMSVLIVR